MLGTDGPEWAVVDGNVQGASHKRDGSTGQDSIMHAPGEDANWAVMAVSDGHGSPKSFRSTIGSFHAARVATDLAEKFLVEMQDEPIPVIEANAKRDLPAKIVLAWTEAVTKDQQDSPITEKDLAKAGVQAQSAGVDADGKPMPNLIAYGATLLLVVVSPKYVFYLQLGDGDILAIFDDGKEITRPIAPDPALIGNETTSLCMPKAEKLFRFRFQPIEKNPPVLIMASTDGYFNAFATEADFEQASADFLRLLGSEGRDYVQANLNEWLDTASSEGSGDDVSVGLIVRTDKLKPAQPKLDLKM